MIIMISMVMIIVISSVLVFIIIDDNFYTEINLIMIRIVTGANDGDWHLW